MRKDCLARELTTEMIVGAFMVMVMLGMGYFTIILSREAWFRQQYEIEMVFDDVMGLREGDNVVVRGMPVGKVSSLELNEKGVHVIARLDEPLRMRTGYDITIVSTSILGGRHLSIDEGPEDGKELDLDVYRGRKPGDLMTDAAELVGELRRELVDGGAIENLRRSSEDLQEMIGRVHAGEGTLGRLLSTNDTLYADIAATASALKEVAGRLERGEGVLGKMMSPEADVLYTDLTETMASLKTITAKLEAGEGTIGQLMSDDALYEEIREAVNETRQAVDDFRETAPITTFSSIFFGAF